MSNEMVPEYWRNKKIYLRPTGSQCKKCGAKYFPPRKICLKCGSTEMEDYPLPERGTLISWTVVRYPPQEFNKYAPYILGLVELEDGLRLIAQIVDVNIDEIKSGMKVRRTIRRAYEESESGIIRYVYKFRPDFEEKM